MLVVLTLLYLIAPYFLFAGGMLRGEFAAGFCLILTAGVGRFFYSEWKLGALKIPPLDRETVRALVLGAVVALVAVTWLGVGGLGHQDTDWAKHNAILHDLTTRAWPVAYDARRHDGQEYLTYYVAYYLPAAAVGKMGGLLAAHLTLFAWTFLGLFTATLWLFRLIGRARWWLLPGFLLLSGLDVVGVSLPSLSHGISSYFEYWASFAQYSSNLSLLSWVPQHAISAWLATSLIIDRVERSDSISELGLFAAVCCLWSPFVTLGLAPVLLAAAWRTRFRGTFSFSNWICGPAIVLLSLIYFRSVDSELVPHSWIIQNGFVVGHQGTLIDLPRGITLLALFWLLEFGLYLILLRRLNQSIPKTDLPGAGWADTWLGMIAVTLTLLPLYRVGDNNDLVMRASIPALFVLWILLLRALAASAGAVSRWPVRALAGCLLVASLQPLFLLAIHAKHMHPRLQYMTIFQRNGNVEDYGYRVEAQPPTVSIADFKNTSYFQYVGQPDSLFYRHLARRPLEAAQRPVHHATQEQFPRDAKPRVAGKPPILH